ncbi:MAG: putative aminohydrolase SsnA [Fretibacterium sp.]|nr:putative aminohydrolase SsnA [Fretibacterium sp.]
MLLIGNGMLVTRDPANPWFENGCVAIEDRLIAAVGKTSDMRSKYPNARFLDAAGGLIMPGFINAHMHFYSAFSRGFSSGGEPAKNFQEVLERLWWRLDRGLTLEDCYYSAMVCLIDCIKNGTTTVLDHHASPYAVRGSLFELGKAARLTGIRCCLSYEVSDRDGPEIVRQGIDENMDFIRWAQKEGDDLLQGTFGLHASMTLSNETLVACREAMGDCNAGFHVHVAEGPGDEVDSEKRYGKRILERFREYGLLGERSMAIHCIHINDREIDILKETNTAVVHNPESNMGNAVGVSPVLKLCERGVLTGLGTDGYVSDMLQSYKLANALQKHAMEHPNVAWGEIPTMLFDNNATIAGRFFKTPLGRLAPGYSADVIVSDYVPPTTLTDQNINGHLLFGTSGRSIVTTIARGKVLMENRELKELDEKEIVGKARELSAKTWERIAAL